MEGNWKSVGTFHKVKERISLERWVEYFGCFFLHVSCILLFVCITSVVPWLGTSQSHTKDFSYLPVVGGFLSNISVCLSALTLYHSEPMLARTGRIKAACLLNDLNCVDGGVKHLQFYTVLCSVFFRGYD